MTQTSAQSVAGFAGTLVAELEACDSEQSSQKRPGDPGGAHCGIHAVAAWLVWVVGFVKS
jgi:hypothetical protein